MVQGDAYLLGSLLQFVQGSYIKGAWNIKSSNSYYKSAAEQLEQYRGDDREELLCAARCGTGFFNVFVSLLPPSVVTIASWIGFAGDRERGLDDLVRVPLRQDKINSLTNMHSSRRSCF